jgi:hypothetical protein
LTAQFSPEQIDEVPYLRRKVGLGVFEDVWHRSSQLRGSLREGHAAFE